MSPTNSPVFKSFSTPTSQKSASAIKLHTNLKSPVFSSPDKSSVSFSPTKSNPHFSPSPKKFEFSSSPKKSLTVKSEPDQKSNFYPSPDHDYDHYVDDDFEAALPVRRSESPDLFADESGCNGLNETDGEK